VVPRVTSLSYADQQIAIYLPSAYDPARKWPLLLVMDPRGRAENALELYRPAAEALGWIVLSSYQTRSDTEDDPNSPALRAMLDHAQKSLAIDIRRIYLAGMSGTAKIAWPFARMLAGSVAGVIGVCGVPPPKPHLRAKVDFAFYGITGTLDFNHREMREFDQALLGLGAMHRLAIFEGPHGWAPQAASGEAVAWLELMAMHQGLTPVREDFVEQRWSRDQAAAEAARTAGDLLTAFERYDQMVRDFETLHDVSSVRRTAAALASDPAVEAARAQAKKLLRAERTYRDRVQRWLDHMAASPTPLPRQRSLADLDISRLRTLAEGGETRSAQSAQRRLETAFVQASFYLPAAYRKRDRLDRAIAVLEVASEIKPESAWPYWQRAAIEAELGHLDQAFAALSSAAERGTIDVERLKGDARWLPLHDDARWPALVVELAAGADQPG